MLLSLLRFPSSSAFGEMQYLEIFLTAAVIRFYTDLKNKGLLPSNKKQIFTLSISMEWGPALIPKGGSNLVGFQRRLRDELTFDLLSLTKPALIKTAQQSVIAWRDLFLDRKNTFGSPPALLLQAHLRKPTD